MPLELWGTFKKAMIMAERDAQSVGDSNPPLVTQVFRSSLGVKLTLSFAFFLAVLFAINAIVGAGWLARHNLWLDAFVFLILFLAGCWLVFFATVFLFSASNTEVQLDREKASLLIPNWRGPTPYFPYLRTSIPYSDIAALETRSEVYYYYILPVVVRCLTVVRKDGRRHQIGYTRENASENAFAYDEIAAELSKRTALEVTHKGMVKGGTRLRALLHDEPPLNEPVLSAAEAERFLSAEGKAWKATIAAIAFVIVAGLAFQGIRIVTATYAGSKHTASTQKLNH